MAHIIVYLNDQFLYDIPLTRETITIGRKPDNDVYLDDHAVSGHHARIITLLNDSLVEDLGSTNGTAVNDRPVRKRALSEGDEIGIHHYRLIYTHKDERVRPAKRGIETATASGQVPARVTHRAPRNCTYSRAPTRAAPWIWSRCSPPSAVQAFRWPPSSDVDRAICSSTWTVAPAVHRPRSTTSTSAAGPGF
jgi:predicted component of type VI protein secretion system